MATNQQTIISANYIISVYLGYIIIITGLIGNLINIFVFTQIKLFRGNQSAFYLLIIVIIECWLLILATGTRVITATFGYDPTRASIVWCKLRAYILQFGTTTLATIICFAAIDQFLSTSYHDRLKRLSTFRLAQRLIVILIIIAALYSVPSLIFNEIHSTAGCTTYNPSYNYYYSFFHLCIVIGILPIIISSLFSLLSYRNVRRITRRQIPIVRRRLDRQLTAMVLVQVALFVITTLPLFSVRTYQLNNTIQNDDAYAIAVNQLIQTTVTTFYNLNYSGSFYVFWMTSTRFRRQVKSIFSKKIWRRFLSLEGNRNQVRPVNQLQNAEPESTMNAN